MKFLIYSVSGLDLDKIQNYEKENVILKISNQTEEYLEGSFLEYNEYTVGTVNIPIIGKGVFDLKDTEIITVPFFILPDKGLIACEMKRGKIGDVKKLISKTQEIWGVEYSNLWISQNSIVMILKEYTRDNIDSVELLTFENKVRYDDILLEELYESLKEGRIIDVQFITEIDGADFTVYINRDGFVDIYPENKPLFLKILQILAEEGDHNG